MTTAPRSETAPRPGWLTRLFHGAARFWRGGALVALLILTGFMYRAYTLPEVYESETLVEMANEREQGTGSEGLRTAVFDARTIEQVALETAAHVQRDADKPGPSVIERTRSAIDLHSMSEGRFLLTFRAATAELARRGCAALATEASQRLATSRTPPLSPQEEARQRGRVVEEKTRELAAFVAQHPELAGKKSDTGEAFLGVPGMRPPSTPAPAPTTDSVLPILTQQKTRLEERIAYVEKQELGGGDEQDKLPPGDALARMDRASLQKMLVQVKAAIAARQSAAERARANTPAPAEPPVESTISAESAASPVQAEWQRLIQAVVDAQQAAMQSRGAPSPALHVVRTANTPNAPISPNRRLFALLGATAGLWVGILYAFARVAMGHARVAAPTQYSPQGLPAFPLEGEGTPAAAATTSPASVAAANKIVTPPAAPAAEPVESSKKEGSLPSFPMEADSADAASEATSASRLAAAKAAPPPKPATLTQAVAVPTIPAAVPSSPVAAPPPPDLPKMRDALPSFPIDAELAKAVDEATRRAEPAKTAPEIEGLARPTPAKALPEIEGLARPTPAKAAPETAGLARPTPSTVSSDPAEIISRPPPPMPLQESDSLPKVIIAAEATEPDAAPPAPTASPAGATPPATAPPATTSPAVAPAPASPAAAASPAVAPAPASPAVAQPPAAAAAPPAPPPPPPPVEAKRDVVPSRPVDGERAERAAANGEKGVPVVAVEGAHTPVASIPAQRSSYASVDDAMRGAAGQSLPEPAAAAPVERKPSRHPSWHAEPEESRSSHRASAPNHESSGDGRITASPIMGIEEGMSTAASGKQGISVYPPPVAPIPSNASPGRTMRLGSVVPEEVGGSTQASRRGTQTFGSPLIGSPSTAPALWTPPATFGSHQMPGRESDPPPAMAAIPLPPKNPSHIGPTPATVRAASPAVQSLPTTPTRGTVVHTGVPMVEVGSTALAIAKPHSSRTRSEPPAASSIVCDVPKGWSPHPSLTESENSDELAALRDQLYRLATRDCFVVGVSCGSEMVAYKSGVAGRLAWMLAQPGHARILLMEGDFDHPIVHRLMRIDMPIASGFSEQMRRRMNGSPPGPWTIVRCAPNLYVLAEGLVRAPGLLPTVHFADSVNELRRAYDLIVIDAPAGGMSVDMRAIDAVTDGVVLAGEADLLDRASSWFGRKQLMAVVSAGPSVPRSR
jgi:Mrp family chromosome partitioning ATPase